MGPDFCLAECYLKTDLITKKKWGDNFASTCWDSVGNLSLFYSQIIQQYNCWRSDSMDPIPRIDVKHIEKFDGTNFQQWKHGLTMQLELSGLQDLVEVNVLSFKKGRFSI